MTQLHDMVGITGSPGTGKKTLAPLLAHILKLDSLSLNTYAMENDLGKRVGTTYSVDAASVRRSMLRADIKPSVVFGHLLADVLRRGEVKRVFVLRCEPRVLKRRLIARGYRKAKLRENLEAELIGVSLTASVERFGEDKVSEFDTTRVTHATTVSAMARALTRLPGKKDLIDWTLSYSSAEKLKSLLSVEMTGAGRI